MTPDTWAELFGGLPMETKIHNAYIAGFEHGATGTPIPHEIVGSDFCEAYKAGAKLGRLSRREAFERARSYPAPVNTETLRRVEEQVG